MLWAGLTLLAGLVVAYHHSFSVPFVFDDVPAIVENPSIRQLWPPGAVLTPALADAGLTVSGRPLLNLSLALNYVMGGPHVAGYHAVNLLIHLLAALTLLGVVRRTLAATPVAFLRENAFNVAFFSALLWAVHPLQTESVTYVVQRAESLVGLCYLLALYGFIRATGKPEETKSGFFWLGLSWSACLAGMACKEVMVSAPLMILLYDRTFVAGSFGAAWRGRRLYYTGLAGTWLLLAWLVAGTAGRGGTVGFGAGISSWQYALTQCGAILHYLRLAAWPSPLVFDYGTGVANGLAAVWLQALALVMLVAGTVVALVRWPVAGFAGAWFFALLAPSSSFVPVASQTMAEHRMYLPLAAVVVLAVTGLHAWLGRRAAVACALLALGCIIATIVRNEDYQSAGRLWGDTVAKRPANARAHHNLGLDELARGRLPEAARRLQDAIALAPESAEPYYSLGLILTRQGRIPEAIESYEKSIDRDPARAAVHNNLANVLFTAGRTAEAGRHYAEAVRLQPNFAGAHSSYGNWLLEAGRAAEALAQCEEAIRLQPGLAEAHFNAGNACLALGRPDPALAHYSEAARLRPDFAEAHNNLGNVLVELGRYPQALPPYERAVQLDPGNPEARRNLVALLVHLGLVPEAVTHLRAYLELRPADQAARAELNRLLAPGRP